MNKQIEFFNEILNHGITLNEAYVLWCRREGVKPHGFINTENVEKSLMMKGYYTNMFSFTPKTDSIFKLNVPEPESKISIGELAEKLREAYPKVQLYGYSARSSKTDVTKKLNEFFKCYKDENYTYNDVIEATHSYVKEYTDRGFDRMKLLKYFIMKDGSSLLAEEINRLKENFDEPEIDEQYKMS